MRRRFVLFFHEKADHAPPLGRKQHSSCPASLLMRSTGVQSGLSSSLMMSGGITFHRRRVAATGFVPSRISRKPRHVHSNAIERCRSRNE
jgi:hypothetical protein